MKDKERINVAIAGAGLTGLTAAYYLQKAGVPVRIFDKADQPGGVIRTHREGGFTYESGPNTGMLSRPEVVELIEELSDLCTLEVADAAAKARWIWKRDRWEPLPSGLAGGVTTPLFTFPDKLRLLAEPFRKKGINPNESLACMVMRRMGRSFLDYAIDPFILGIYSGDPGRLVTRYAFPKLYRLEQEYGSFIRGAIKKSKEAKPEREIKVTKEIFSTEGGLSNLIHALEQKIGPEKFRPGCQNLRFDKHEKGFTCNQDNEVYTHIISTTGGYALKKLFPFLEREKLKKIRRMEYSKVVQVALGFNRWEGIPIRAFGGLVPSVEKRGILGILFISSFLKNRAPKNGALLSVFLGGIRNPGMIDLSDDSIQRIVEEEVTEMLGLKIFEPDLIKIFRYEHAIPQYGFESDEKMEAIAALESSHPGLLLAGNIRDGIGMADRIGQGKSVAEQIYPL